MIENALINIDKDVDIKFLTLLNAAIYVSWSSNKVIILPFVNLGIGTSALELELELILQTSSFPVP